MKYTLSPIQVDILNTIGPNQSGRLIVSPRTGKTAIIISLIKRDKPKSILWVTPSVTLKDTDIPNEFATWSAKHHLRRTTIITYAALHTITGTYDLIVLDEDQYVTENNISNLLSYSLIGKQIIGMTGTNTKSNDKQMLYDALNLPVIYTFSINEAQAKDVIADYRIHVVHIPMSTTYDLKTSAGFITSELKQYTYYHNRIEQEFNQARRKALALKRMHVIHSSPSKFRVASDLFQKAIAHEDQRTLLFMPTIEQANTVSPNHFHSKSYDTHYKAFKDNLSNHLVLVQSGGVGHSFPAVDNIIVSQCDSDVTGKTTQKICRGLIKKERLTNIFLLCLDGTQDEVWVRASLQTFDPSKINHISPNETPL